MKCEGEISWTNVRIAGTSRLGKYTVDLTIERIDGRGWRWSIVWPTMFELKGGEVHRLEQTRERAEHALETRFADLKDKFYFSRSTAKMRERKAIKKLAYTMEAANEKS
jgi:hypothetical protein